ncbi:hypothetical protein HDU76_012757 [Blyttiomyces sp. JEL0837]|nr:hypothetical protein HDU76_012757 [Blyttiomyces sp. JEL0837]
MRAFHYYLINHLAALKYTIAPSHKLEKTRRPLRVWPTKGNIKINNLVLRYRENLPSVIKDITLEIPGGSKVAIVGRTGAGKSSIILGLLRLIEPTSGNIEIDNIDICKIGLHDLRKKIAVIPQDPVLFSGTLRSNLDPFDEFEDHQLWEVLARCDLKGVVGGHPDQLEMFVAEGGENWSTGQRQLICLARAMLRDAAVVILDEATASVDLATDDFIQKAIRKDFKNKTVLTIAHRLNTIIDNDKILVLDHGKIAEYDSPAELLKKENGVFLSMIDETGEANAAMLKAIAAKALASHGLPQV